MHPQLLRLQIWLQGSAVGNLSVLHNDDSLNTADLLPHQPTTAMPPCLVQVFLLPGWEAGEGRDPSRISSCSTGSCLHRHIKWSARRQEWKLWERLCRSCPRNLPPHSLLLCSLSASPAHGTTWPSLPEAVFQSQEKLQAQTWRATQARAARLEPKPWLEEGTAASAETPVTVNNLSTLWRGRRDYQNQSPRVKKKK